MSAAPTYASRYTHVLSLVEAYLLEFRRNKTEIPRSRFSIRSPAGTRRDERGGIWAVIDHIAATGMSLIICTQTLLMYRKRRANMRGPAQDSRLQVVRFTWQRKIRDSELQLVTDR